MTRSSEPELVGLVLAGGESSRMGQDKGALVYHGVPQVNHCVSLLAQWCLDIRVSVRAEQQHLETYELYSLVIDNPDDDVHHSDEAVGEAGKGPAPAGGPAAGLLAAWSQLPGRALLVLAVDMPLVNESILAQLVGSRDSTRLATAYRKPDGMIEPLVAIWEPAARPVLERAVRDGSGSLRHVLESSGEVRCLETEGTGWLSSANSPAERASAQRKLDHEI